MKLFFMIWHDSALRSNPSYEGTPNKHTKINNLTWLSSCFHLNTPATAVTTPFVRGALPAAATHAQLGHVLGDGQEALAPLVHRGDVLAQVRRLDARVVAAVALLPLVMLMHKPGTHSGLNSGKSGIIKCRVCKENITFSCITIHGICRIPPAFCPLSRNYSIQCYWNLIS